MAMNAKGTPAAVGVGAILDPTILKEARCAPTGDGSVQNFPSLCGRGKAFLGTLQRHRVVQAETNVFLAKTVAGPLSQGLAAVALKQPSDPVGYLVQWLRRYADNEERKHLLVAERAHLAGARAEMKTKRKDELRIAAEKATTYDSEGLTTADRNVLGSLENTTWLSQVDFQRILDYLKCALGANAAYMMQLRGEGNSGGAVLQYVAADSESTFLVDMTLKEDEGVVWDALMETPEPGKALSETSEDSDSEGETEFDEEPKNTETETDSANNNEPLPEAIGPKGKIGAPLVISDVMAEERVKFWRMVRPGSLAAVSLTYEDPANKVNVDSMREYLIEVQKREKITQEEENALEGVASTEHHQWLGKEGSLSGGSRSKRSTVAGEGDGDAENSEEEIDSDGPEGGSHNKTGAAPPVAFPTLNYTTVKMIFCIDTLGMDEKITPSALKRLSQFVEAMKSHCIRTRLAAVRAQAENTMDDEQNKMRAYEIEKSLKKVESEAVPNVEAEKTLAIEHLEAKLQQARQDRNHRRQAQQALEPKDGQHIKTRSEHAEYAELQAQDEVLTEKQQGAAENAEALDTKDANEGLTAGRTDDDDERPPTGHEGDTAADGAESARTNVESEAEEEEEYDSIDKEEPEEDRGAALLEAIPFSDLAEAKVKYEAVCELLCTQYEDLLLDIENMFIPLTASATPILAACLLLLGEPPYALRMNSKLPQTDWDWQKLRSRLGATFVQRLSSYNPRDRRPPPPPDAPPAEKGMIPLSQIALMVAESPASTEDAAPLIEIAPALFLLDKWIKLAIDYRRKYLTVTAAIIYLDAKRKKSTLPRLELEVDVDFEELPLPPSLFPTDE